MLKASAGFCVLHKSVSHCGENSQVCPIHCALPGCKTLKLTIYWKITLFFKKALVFQFYSVTPKKKQKTFHFGNRPYHSSSPHFIRQGFGGLVLSLNTGILSSLENQPLHGSSRLGQCLPEPFKCPVSPL